MELKHSVKQSKAKQVFSRKKTTWKIGMSLETKQRKITDKVSQKSENHLHQANNPLA
jgi:hypothetical protein